MALQHAVLSLLRAGPSHGYELKTAFEHAVGPQWGPLNIGHLYQVLDRLSREGLVTSTRVPQGTRPERIVYELTDAGAAELESWLAEPSPRTAGFRDDFFLKMVAAARTSDPAVIEQVVARQRAYLLRELHNLHELRRQPGTELMVGLLLTAAARHVEADLAFLDEAQEVLGAHGSATAPSTVEVVTPGGEHSRRQRSA